MKLLVAHCGDSSTTLNASLAGLIDAARDEGEPVEVWGARHGADGLLSKDWTELAAVSPAALEGIMRTPGSAIGTSARGVSAEEAAGVAAELDKRGVQALVLTGGAGAMASAATLEQAARQRGAALRVIGLPNAAANEVTCTDHAPGFASAARFCALAVRDIAEHSRATPSGITVVETLGRNAGWVAAAAALAREAGSDGPHLIDLPEHSRDEQRLAEDARAAAGERGRAVIVVPEGSADGCARAVEAATGIPTRAERLGLLGRSCAWALSEIDVEESYRCGRAAAEAALGGASGVMIALRRQPGLAYRSFPNPVPFSDNPGRERRMPEEWVGDAGATEGYLEWLRPLVGEIPPLERIL